MRATPILDALFASLPAARFLEAYWPDRSVVAHGSVERLPGAFRAAVLKDAQTLTRSYQGKFTFGNATASPRTVNMDYVRPDLLLRMGLSLYLTEMLKLVPAFAELLRQLENEIGAPAGCARVGAFVAAPGNGVTCHFDCEEVISIQLSGRKRWRIAKVALDHPAGMQFNPGEPLLDEDFYAQVSQGFPAPSEENFEIVDMAPGSVLFMPRGTWHATEAGEESMSVSIMLPTPTAADSAIAALRMRLLAQPQWRRPLYGAWGEKREQVERQWRELLPELAQMSGDLPFEAALLAPLGQAERVQRLNAGSRMQKCPNARMELNESAGAVQAAVWATDAYGAEQRSLVLEVPPPMRELFDWLARNEAAFSVAEVAQRCPSLPAEQHLRTVDALIRGRYLKQLWF